MLDTVDEVITTSLVRLVTLAEEDGDVALERRIFEGKARESRCSVTSTVLWRGLAEARDDLFQQRGDFRRETDPQIVICCGRVHFHRSHDRLQNGMCPAGGWTDPRKLNELPFLLKV